MPIVRRTDLLVFCVSLLLAVIGCRTGGKPTGRVSFSEPNDGATVTAPVKVVMAVEGIAIKPAGEVVEGTGHHHILINKGFMSPGQVIPTDSTHRHFGKGQTETTLNLPPGTYKLTLQFADGLHRSYGEDLSATVNIRVAAR